MATTLQLARLIQASTSCVEAQRVFNHAQRLLFVVDFLVLTTATVYEAVQQRERVGGMVMCLKALVAPRVAQSRMNSRPPECFFKTNVFDTSKPTFS